MISTNNVLFALQFLSSSDALSSPLVCLKGMQCKCVFTNVSALLFIYLFVVCYMYQKYF